MNPDDQARASILVNVDADTALRVFTDEIDAWWRRGPKYRVGGAHRGIICIEPCVGGRLFESFDTDAGTRVVDTGRVVVWEPPSRVVFEWRAANFAPHEKTEVEVVFEPRGSGTMVTVTHRGWGNIRPDHPARHGLAVGAFLRMMGMWWGELLRSLRAHAGSQVGG